MSSGAAFGSNEALEIKSSSSSSSSSVNGGGGELRGEGAQPLAAAKGEGGGFVLIPKSTC